MQGLRNFQQEAGYIATTEQTSGVCFLNGHKKPASATLISTASYFNWITNE